VILPVFVATAPLVKVLIFVSNTLSAAVYAITILPL
jgi:hypothetical protein